VGTGPVGGVDGRSGNESPKRLAARRIGALGNPDVLEGGYPIVHNRKDARIWFSRAVSLVHTQGFRGMSATQGDSLSRVARMQGSIMSVVV